MSSRGKRYNGEKKKLNIKKVFAVIIALAVLIMVITGITKLLKNDAKTEEKTVANKYFPVYTEEKWGVINSRGEIIIKPTYEESIIVVDNAKDIFICTFDVDYDKNTYKTKAINSKNEEIITGYDSIQPLENYDEYNNLWYEKDVLLVSKNGKYGLVDFKGKELLKCEYDKIETLKGVRNSILVKKDDKYGLVDNIGLTIIENEYKSIKPISEKYEDGYIVQNFDNKYGVIEKSKNKILEEKYEDIRQIYGNENYVVKEQGKWQITNKEGDVYLRGRFDEVESINGEKVLVKNKNKYGVLNLDGKTKIEIEYQELNYTFDNNYIFKKDNKYGVINLEKEEVIKPEYDNLIYRADVGFFEASKSDSIENIFIGNDFKTQLSGILSEVNIDLGYIKIRTEEKYKYYNLKFEEKSNKEILTTNTLFLDKKNGKYGFVNKEGIVVVDYIYDDANEQNEFGYASVKKDGMWGCINSKGKEVITPAYKLENTYSVEFINKWHKGEDLNLNYYTN